MSHLLRIFSDTKLEIIYNLVDDGNNTQNLKVALMVAMYANVPIPSRIPFDLYYVPILKVILDRIGTLAYLQPLGPL